MLMPKIKRTIDPLVFSGPIVHGEESPTIALAKNHSEITKRWKIVSDTDEHGLLLQHKLTEADIRVLWTTFSNGYMSFVIIYQPHDAPFEIEEYRSIANGLAPGLINHLVYKRMRLIDKEINDDHRALSLRWDGPNAKQEAEHHRKNLAEPDKYKVYRLLAYTDERKVHAGYAILKD